MKVLKNSFAVIIMLSGAMAEARLLEFKNKDFAEAKKSETFLRFEMSSKKLGLFTTSFYGYVKSFKINGEIKENKLASGASVEFAVHELDTDIDARNEKLWKHCLDEENHPNIRLVLDEEVPLSGEEVKVPATIWLRGDRKPIVITVKSSTKDNSIVIDLKTQLSLKALEIPDPSIAIASVKDNIAVHGVIEIKNRYAVPN